MKKLFALALLLPVVLLGCAAPTLPAASKKSGTYRIGFSSEADLGDVPSLMAQDALRAQGYTVEQTFFAGADLQAVALLGGELDMSNGSMRTNWSAAAKDDNAITIMEQTTDNWLLITKSEITTCDGLDGARIAWTNSASVNAALIIAYLAKNCPNAKPQYLLIANSSARATALLAGQADAAPVELADVVELEEKAGDKLHALVNFGETLPLVMTTGVEARRDWAKAHPEMVRDYIKALLQVHRQIKANPKLAADAAVKYLKMDPAEAQGLVELYLKNNIWDVNGGMTQDDIDYSLAFYINSGTVPAGVTAAQVTDLSYLEAVLNEIGKQ